MITWREFCALVTSIVTAEKGDINRKIVMNTLRAIFSRDPDAMIWATEGFLEQFIMLNYVPFGLVRRMWYKQFWYDLAAEERIPLPPTVRVCRGGVVRDLAPIDPDVQYIYKPDKGMGGKTIRLLRGRDLPGCGSEDYVVQRQLVDCNLPVVRHFRLVTLWDGAIFAVYDMRARQPTQHVSNRSSGGGVSNCGPGFDCPDLSEMGRRAASRLANQMAEVHSRRLPNVFSIGWDIMLDCEDSETHAYMLEGNIFHGAVFDDTRDSKAAEYREHARRFEAEHRRRRY